MKTRYSALLFTSRPISWLNTAFPFAAGYLVSGGRLDAIWVIGTLYFLIPYNLLLYGVNDIFDYESDIKNSRKGGVEGAITPKSLHPLIMRTILWTNTPFIIGLLLLGTPFTALILIGTVLMAIIYSAPPRLKELPVFDSISSSLHFVGPLIYGVSFHEFSHPALLCCSAFFFWGVASHAFGAVQDIAPDRTAHIRSIATVWGARLTTRIATLLYVIASALLCWQGGIFTLAGIFLFAYVINILPYWSVNNKTSSKTNVAWRRFIGLNYLVGLAITILLIVY